MTAATRPRKQFVHEEFIKVGSNRLLVRCVGDGPPLLLVNGLGAHTAMWATLEEALRGFRIISYDGPGAGRSTIPAVPPGLGSLAHYATRVLDHFEVDQADVIGYSMGGMVTQQLLADYPERVRRAVLVATSPGMGGMHGEPKAMLNIATPIRYLSPRLYMATIGGLAGGRARHDREWIAKQGALRMRHAPTIRGYLTQLASMTGWSGLPKLRGIEHPVLIVAGDDDPLTPVANAMLLCHLLPQARMRILSGEGHLLLMDTDSPALYTIRQFMAAESLDNAPVWDEAHEVDEETLHIALAGASTFQVQPLGFMGSIIRRRVLESGE